MLGSTRGAIARSNFSFYRQHQGKEGPFLLKPTSSFEKPTGFFPPTKAPSALTSAVWLLLLMPKLLCGSKIIVLQLFRQVANCPLELLKTKNPGRERGSVLNIRLPWKSCARNNLYSDASHRWHNYLSVRS